MAVLASTTVYEVPGRPEMEIIKGTVTTTGDTYVSKFSTIYGVTAQLYSGGTTVLKTTVSGGTVTITGTSGDVIYLVIYGTR